MSLINEKQLRVLIKEKLRAKSRANVRSITRRSSQDDSNEETSGVIEGEKFTINGVSFQSMPFQGAADSAMIMTKKIAGRKDTGSDADKQAIIDIVYKTADIPGYNTPEKLENLKGRLGTKNESFWSSWFYTAAYKQDSTYPNRNSMSYPGKSGYKNRTRVFKNPESYKGKELYMMFKPEEAPIFPGDGVFTWRSTAKGQSFDDIPKGGPAHMRILGTDGKFYGGNESKTAKGSSMSMNGNMFNLQKGYLGVFKRVKVLGTGVDVRGDE